MAEGAGRARGVAESAAQLLTTTGSRRVFLVRVIARMPAADSSGRHFSVSGVFLRKKMASGRKTPPKQAQRPAVPARFDLSVLICHLPTLCNKRVAGQDARGFRQSRRVEESFLPCKNGWIKYTALSDKCSNYYPRGKADESTNREG